MELVLVSACLLGEAVRYNGGDMRCDHAILQRWLQENRVVPVCPQVAGGLAVPRPRAEITNGAGGMNVLAAAARAIDSNGRDVTAFLVCGAERALEQARAKNIRVAILKEGSPSCGSGSSSTAASRTGKWPGSASPQPDCNRPAYMSSAKHGSPSLTHC